MEFDFDRESKKPLIKKIVKEIIILGVEIALVIGLAYGIIQFAVEKSAMLFPTLFKYHHIKPLWIMKIIREFINNYIITIT